MKILNIEADKSIFDIIPDNQSAVCVTTNGVVKSNGCAVMGAGIAKECKDRFPIIQVWLGQKLKYTGNHAYYFTDPTLSDNVKHIITFPTKHHWKENSDIELIKQSCMEATEIMDTCKHILTKCYLPKPGCSNGHLDWDTLVKPVISELLDDRFIVVVRD